MQCAAKVHLHCPKKPQPHRVVTIAHIITALHFAPIMVSQTQRACRGSPHMRSRAMQPCACASSFAWHLDEMHGRSRVLWTLPFSLSVWMTGLHHSNRASCSASCPAQLVPVTQVLLLEQPDSARAGDFGGANDASTSSQVQAHPYQTLGKKCCIRASTVQTTWEPCVLMNCTKPACRWPISMQPHQPSNIIYTHQLHLQQLHLIHAQKTGQAGGCAGYPRVCS